MDVAGWLDDLNLAQYADLFAENALDSEDVLGELTELHLKELGLPLGHRLKLLKAIGELKGLQNPLMAIDVSPAEDSAEPISSAQTSEAGKSSYSHIPREAERRHLTILFCDIVNSTGIAERLDPEEMRELIQAFQSATSEVIVRFGGHVAKFLGDGALAYFGWPQAHEDAAERAVRAGLHLIVAVGVLDTPLEIRVGIATGLVVVGDLVGDGEAQERTVVGETPNLAARLQDLAAPGTIIVAEGTRRLVGDTFRLSHVGMRDLKGISNPVDAWKVIGEGSVEGRFEALHGKKLTPLFGRDEELDLLNRRWARAKQGQGQLVLLSGEPGIGKSRLAEGLLEQLQGESKRVVRMFCSHYHQHSALFPTISHFERAAHFEQNDAAEGRLEKLETFIGASGLSLTEKLPLIAAMMSVSTGDRYAQLDLDPRTQKRQTLDALVQMIEAFSEERPILMIVEDANWLDPTSIEMFDLIVERIQKLKLLLIIIFRPGFVTHWTGPSYVTSMTLNRLDQGQGMEIVNCVTDGKAMPGSVLNNILSKADGIPLFVEELTRTVIETGLLIDAGDHYELSEPISTLTIPDSLQDSLLARLDKLAPAREIAQIAACIGREFDYRLLAKVAAPKPSNELNLALGSLVGSELMFAHGQPPDATFRFKHALVQDAAYQTLLRSRRAFYHQRIARALEEMSPDILVNEPQVVAHHYTMAGVPDKSIDYWMRAGRKAMAGSGHVEAIEHFSRALAQIEEMQEGRDRDQQELEILIALAVPLSSTMGYASTEIERTYSRARELCQSAGETPKLFPVLYGLWRYYLLSANYKLANELSITLMGLAEQLDDLDFRIAAQRSRGSTLFYIGEIAQAQVHLQYVIDTPATDDARTHLLTFDVVDPWVASHAYAGWTNWLLGYPDRARRESEQAMKLAQKIDHKFSIALSKCFATWTYQLCGDRERTAKIAEEVLEFSAENMFPFWVGWAEVLLGWAMSAEAKEETTSHQISTGLSNWRSNESQLGLSYFLWLLSEANEIDGHAEAAVTALEEAETFVERTGERWWVPEIQRLRCQRLLTMPSPDLEAAEAGYLQAISTATSMKALSLALRSALGLGRLYMSQQKIVEARKTLSNIYSRFDEGFDSEDLRQAAELQDQLRADAPS